MYPTDTQCVRPGPGTGADTDTSSCLPWNWFALCCPANYTVNANFNFIWTTCANTWVDACGSCHMSLSSSFVPVLIHILATCNRHQSSCLPAALSWPAFCLPAKLHCPLNWSLLMKIATVFEQFAKHPLATSIACLHFRSIPFASPPRQICAIKRQTLAGLTNLICCELLYDLNQLIGSSAHLPGCHYACLCFPGKWNIKNNTAAAQTINVCLIIAHFLMCTSREMNSCVSKDLLGRQRENFQKIF